LSSPFSFDTASATINISLLFIALCLTIARAYCHGI
jgi:hypothetical protein